MQVYRQRLLETSTVASVMLALVACGNGSDTGAADNGDGSADTAAADEGGSTTDDATGDENSANDSDDDEMGTGSVATGASTIPVDAATQGCAAPTPGVAPLRRLSNYEYYNTLVDLIGDEDLVRSVTRGFPREPTSLGFRNAADALKITPLLADQYLQAALQVGKAIPDIPGVIPCNIEEADGDCVQEFVETFGARAYRRPLTGSELERYSNLYSEAVTSSFRDAFELIGAGMLTSSHFLFRVELDQGGADPYRPGGYEMASRLSYLLWQSMPDDELFAAAAAGDLETNQGIADQVRRMLADGRAFQVYEFFAQWLDLDELGSFSRDGESYAEAPGNLPQLLDAETRTFVYDVLAESGTFEDLIAAPYTFANRDLATHYALDTTPEGADFVKVEAPDRAGVLTGGMLVVHDRPIRSSIVKRGLKIRTDLLCQLVPAPPDNVDTTLGPIDGELTQRERLEAHRTKPSCSGCHALMDPLGALFEGFDATGKPRSVDEGGAAVVTSDTVQATRDLDGDYADGVEFARALSTSDQARECFATQAFRFFYGRDVTAEDSCSFGQLMTAFERNDYQIVDLLLGLAQTDQFLYRSAGQDPTGQDAANQGEEAP